MISRIANWLPETVLCVALSSAFAPCAANAASITAPAAIAVKHNLTICSDLSNPPADGTADDGSTPQGAEVDVMKALGSAMGVPARIDNYQFSGIFAALDTGKCDMIMASLGKTPERAQRYELVDYWRVASGLLVPAGNPRHLTKFEDLGGTRVAVLLGSRNASVLHTINEQLKSAGKPPIETVELNTNAAAYQDLALGRVDAFVSDTVNINYYHSRSHGRFEVGGVPVPPKTWTIAIPKGNVELRQAVQAAIDQMNANGDMQRVVKTWGIAEGASLCSTVHPCE